MAIGSKVILGDPEVPATFRTATGVSLEDGEKTIAIICLAPYGVTAANDTIKSDIQDQLRRRMVLRGIKVANDGDVAYALDDLSETFAPQAIAKSMDVDYIVQVQVDSVSYNESEKSTLLRGRSQGVLQVFEVRGTREAGDRHTIEVLRKEYRIEFPRSHPVSSSQTTQRDFAARFLQFLADDLGRHFYDVPTSELYNHDFE